MFSLSEPELSLLLQLNTPGKIQNFLDTLSFNYEDKEETCMSPRRVIREKRAHCLEGAMLAATALLIAGGKPLVLSLKVSSDDDYDHVITLFKQNGYWGAISKTNHAVLRYRDPIYKTIRELVLSYFNEYFLTTTGEKTLQGYSKPINLRRFGTNWITSEEELWKISETIFYMPHISIIPEVNKKFIRKASKIEIDSADIKEWK
jgi:hypothetical protein